MIRNYPIPVPEVMAAPRSSPQCWAGVPLTIRFAHADEPDPHRARPRHRRRSSDGMCAIRLAPRRSRCPRAAPRRPLNPRSRPTSSRLSSSGTRLLASRPPTVTTARALSANGHTLKGQLGEKIDVFDHHRGRRAHRGVAGSGARRGRHREASCRRRHRDRLHRLRERPALDGRPPEPPAQPDAAGCGDPQLRRRVCSPRSTSSVSGTPTPSTRSPNRAPTPPSRRPSRPNNWFGNPGTPTSMPRSPLDSAPSTTSGTSASSAPPPSASVSSASTYTTCSTAPTAVGQRARSSPRTTLLPGRPQRDRCADHAGGRPEDAGSTSAARRGTVDDTIERGGQYDSRTSHSFDSPAGGISGLLRSRIRPRSAPSSPEEVEAMPLRRRCLAA